MTVVDRFLLNLQIRELSRLETYFFVNANSSSHSKKPKLRMIRQGFPLMLVYLNTL